MRVRAFLSSWFFLCLQVCFLPAAVRADDVVFSDDGMTCTVDGNEVRLSWTIQTFAPLEKWVISRDGEVIAELDPGAATYTDTEVPDGEHLYTLTGVNLIGGGAGVVARCQVVVGDFGIKCAYDGSQVNIEWGLIPIDGGGIAIRAIVIRRNGSILATLSATATRYSDVDPPAGTHRYTVHVEFLPGQQFLIGACTVRVPFEGFVCTVEPPRVTIDWSGVPLPRCGDQRCAFDFFRVVRDGELIAQLEPNVFQYVDLPGPGEHHYVVYAGFGDETPGTTPPYYLIGECKVAVPGGEVPPPEELTCLDLDAPPGVEISDYLTRHDVLLVWQKPLEYDWVLVARNGHIIARIPGSQFHYIDRNLPPGVYSYAVSGVLGGNVSEPATCQVRIPREPLPPPTDLTCQYLGDMDPSADELHPDGRVVMSWRNGAPYQWIVVVRNGVRIARIPGEATSFVDREPIPGWNTYGVFGVVGIFRSDKTECRVWVPPGMVPPPEDLTCEVICPVPEPTPVEPVAGQDVNALDVALDRADETDPVPRCAVLLRWSNPARYDWIVIARNKMRIAVLPGDAESYIDRLPFLEGEILYSVVGAIGNRASEAATCTVEVHPPYVPPPRDFDCVVYPVSVEPVDSVALDDAGLAVEPDGSRLPVVRLTWVNPIHYSGLVLARDGEILVRLRGDAMVYRDVNPGSGHHVYVLWGIGRNGVESQRVRCEVDVPDAVVPPVEDLTCLSVVTDSGGPSAALRWVNPVAYTAILILRNGAEIAQLPGDTSFYLDRALEPGVYEYAVIAFIGNRRSRPVECRVVVPGVPPRNLLYFSSGLFETDPATGDAVPIPENADGRITCLASNADPIQGWSFGVCSDPSVLAVQDVNLDGTETAALNEGQGPSFLSINQYEQGVTMGVIIDEHDPMDTLPVGGSHKILNIRYAAGPDGMPGGVYPVRYCSRLGQPPVAVLFVVEGFEVAPASLGGWVRLPFAWPTHIRRGDSNGDDVVDMSDSITTLGWLFLGEEEPGCLEQADANGSREVNIADPVYTLQFLFSGGPPPPPPFPDCGPVRQLYLGCEHPSCPQPIGAN